MTEIVKIIGTVALYRQNGVEITKKKVHFPTSLKAQTNKWIAEYGGEFENVLVSVNQPQLSTCGVSEVNRIANAVKHIENITGCSMSLDIFNTLLNNPKLYSYYRDEHKRHLNAEKVITTLRHMTQDGKYCKFSIPSKNYPKYGIICKAEDGVLVGLKHEDLKNLR